METTTIGKKLRELRGDRTTTEVAEHVGISDSALRMYELDERVPRDGIKVRLAKFFGVSVGSLFFGE